MTTSTIDAWRESAGGRADLYAASLTAETIPWIPAIKYPLQTPFTYQIAAVQQILGPRRHAYCAHHPGAGKTPIALIASVAYALSDPVIIICPPSIVYQWARQAYRWTGVPWLVCATARDVVEFLSDPAAQLPARFIVPDSLVHLIPPSKVRFALAVADEAHRLKTRDARRTRAFFGHGLESGLAQRADKILCMSGTPMPSNPTDLYPFLHACFPEIAPNFGAYAARYCPPEKEWVWRGKTMQEIIVYKTATNKEELARRLRETGLIRPLRADILAQLPPVREDRLMLKLGVKSGRSVEQILAEWKHYGDKDPALATERKDLGILKAQASTPYLETVIDGGDAPLIFTWHTDAADHISKALNIPVVHGKRTVEERRDAIDSFVEGRAKAIVCTIGAAGTGIDGFQRRTDLCIFVESHYGNVEMEQAVGRLWRTGQRNATRVVYIDSDHPIDIAVEESRGRKRDDSRDIIGS